MPTENQSLESALTKEEIETIASRFQMQRDDDDLNALIIASGHRGLSILEEGGHGFPLDIWDDLSLIEQMAFVSGRGALNEKDMKDTGGLFFGEKIKAIMDYAFVSEPTSSAANAFFSLIHSEIGTNLRYEKLVDRMNAMPYSSKIHALSRIYQPAALRTSFPPKGEYPRVLRPGHKGITKYKASYNSREASTRHLIDRILEKTPGKLPELFEGWIVPSTDGDGEYFVRKDFVIRSTGAMYLLSCTCPDNWKYFISTKPRTLTADPCKHIEQVQHQYAA